MTKESFAEFFRSKLFFGILTGVAIMIVVLCIFEAGVAVGYHEATFSERWGQNYGNNFGNSNSMALSDTHIPQPDGTLGKILSISGGTDTTTLIVSSTHQPEEKIVIGSDTIIRDHENTITVSDLSVGSYVVVIGEPNDQGEIQAKLIRVVPAPDAAIGSNGPKATSTQP